MLVESSLPDRRVAANWLEEILMVQQHFNGMHDFTAGVFGKCAATTGIQRLIAKFLGNLLHGKEQHGQLGIATSNLPRGLKSIHFWHGQIQHDDVWFQCLGFVHGLMTVARVGTYRPTTMGFNQPAEKAPDSGIVIGDEYAYSHNQVHGGRQGRDSPGGTRPSIYIMPVCWVLVAIPFIPDYQCR